jgi:predicted RNase H-like nuclease (RuvC/YqgF family)
LKVALESKDALISELEQKTRNQTRESEDMKKQVKEANERTRIAELEGEKSIQMCDAFFLQTTRQNDQLQQNESEINCLRREIEYLHAQKDIMFIL